MTNLREIPKANIYSVSAGENAAIDSGSLVDLLSVDEMVKLGVEEEFFVHNHLDFLKNTMLCGEKGPYPIHSIAEWPCGKVMLYLDLGDKGTPGVYASDFKIAE